MSSRLITLYKQPGIRPVGVEGTWRRLMAKCLLQVAGSEAKAACRTIHLTGEVEAGIDGAIHAMRVLWEEHTQEEDWVFLLIDAHNVFNEENRTPCYGLSGTSGPVSHSLHLSATATGPHWWYKTRGTGQATSCIARKAHWGPTPHQGASGIPTPCHTALVR